MDKNKLAGHLAAAGAYIIFGFNIIFCKDIASTNTVSPIVLFTLRALGASALFWACSLFTPKEKVPPRDLLLILLASMVGLFIPQLTFLGAITMTTSIDSAILGTLSPIFTMIFAAIFLKEPVTFKKASGVAMSFLGILLLILNSVNSHNGVDSTRPAGVALMLLNALSFAAYLGIFRPLISRYSVVTFMKWMFLFSLIVSLPISFKGLIQTDFSAIGTTTALEILFVIVFATFVAYFLIPLGQKKIRPTLVSLYSYLQPMIACAVSIVIGMDSLNLIKLLSIILVFGGVALVSRSRSAGKSEKK
ncbi:MAG: DMT family transporter [Candidatus Cryptobacteroides sp.]